MRWLVGVLCWIMTLGCTAAPQAMETQCPFLVWMGGPEPELIERLEGVPNVSIFQVLSGRADKLSNVSIEGRLANFRDSVYLIPAGSNEYVKTYSDRIELRFSSVERPTDIEIEEAGVVMVVGELSREMYKWVIADPVYISSLRALSEECVNL